MSLGVVSDSKNTVPANWDWKAEYVERMANGAGLELFAESSVTPDTMLFLAGPPRMGTSGFTEKLSPIGLVTDVTISTDNQLRPIWEMGTDITYFTRGKALHTMQIGAMVANKASLMRILSRQSPTHTTKLPDNSFNKFWMNLDSETMSKPFGILVLFNVKGSLTKPGGSDNIAAVYLENCNIGSFNFGMNNQALLLQENVTIMFDRMVEVNYS